MCGIVGYSGNLNGINPVIEGLTRLEYRGYDSAGVCFKNQKELSFLKKEGKIDNLKEVLSQKNPESNVVIGHTRWATHGKVNDTNAHPHVDKDFAIVHNGIIENANQIKEKLISQGVVFESETDSEVFLRLLVEEHKKCKSVLEAVANTFKQVEGNSAFVIMNTFDDNIYSVKRSAPLVCGENLTTKEVFCSSDPYALIGFATKIYFPQDEVICVSGTKDGEVKTLFYELNLKHSGRFDIQGTSNHVDVASKGNYEHYMIKEI